MTEVVGAEVERLDVAQLGGMIRERRGCLLLRQAAQEAGVSFSTLSRVEAGAQPDLASFTRLCAWLGVPASRFFTPVAPRTTQPLDEALSHLQADPRLTPEAATAISSMLKTMYDSLAGSEPPRAVVACHLRASSVMRPGVPGRLSALLTDMHDELERLMATGEV